MDQIIERATEALKRWRQFVLHDAWRIGMPGEKPPHGLLIKHVRVVILLLQNFGKNALLLRASALAFASVLAIVPFLALTFFVIETFNLDEVLYAYASKALDIAGAQYMAPETPMTGSQTAQSPTGPPEVPGPPQGQLEAVPYSSDEFKMRVAESILMVFAQETGDEADLMANPVKTIVDFAKRGENPRSMGLAGLIFLVTTVFGLIMNIESAFNQIWGLKDSRSWYRMFSDYLVMVLAIPFFVSAIVSVMAVLHHSALNLPLSQALVYRSAQLLAIWLGFLALYSFVPNTRVRFRYALLGAVVAGTMWSTLTWLYIAFQYGLANYSLLYSTFAQFPVLLMWVYFSWVIVLFGAELAFAYQNEQTFALERHADRASYAYREALGLRMMMDIARRFERGSPGLSAEEAAREWNVPVRLLNTLLDDFQKANMVVCTSDKPPRHTPGRPLDKITVGDVIDALREAGCDPTALRDEATFRPLLDKLRAPDDAFLDMSLSQLAQTIN
ncbi:MAG: YhjD/YihY/BrkB family envelope integrity protein [FCB group bacterium]|jgi:membrane protein|nr:YhjD/YihY/BrkB family envelope integrity protein [FCB group bacterium]